MRDISKLDRKRSYGSVVGHQHIAFIQDGYSYCADGTLYVENGSLPPLIPEVAKEDKAPEKTEEELKALRNLKRSEAMRQRWAERRAELEREAFVANQGNL